MTRRISPLRTLAVTGGLIVIGAVCGAAIGALLMTMASLRDRAPTTISDVLGGMAFGAAFGAPIGAVLTPPLAWIFLRRVPLGRAIVETAIGTIAGAAIALIFVPPAFFFAAIVGFIVAGARLFAVTRHSERAVPPTA